VNLHFHMLEAKFNALEVLAPFQPFQFAMGDVHGAVHYTDIRHGKHLICGRNHPNHSGSIRSMALHPAQPVLASVSLGRWLMLNDVRTYQVLYKAYIKQKGTACLFTKDDVFQDKYCIKADNQEVNIDEVWNNLAEAPAPKKKKTQSVTVGSSEKQNNANKAVVPEMNTEIESTVAV
jgi:hypothetical protein